MGAIKAEIVQLLQSTEAGHTSDQAAQLSALLDELPDGTLNLIDSDIKAEGATALAEALKHNSRLTKLDLSGNRIGAEGATALAEALKHNSSLAELVLSFYNGKTGWAIGNTSAIAIAQALEHNRSLTKLDLSGYCIGAEGATALAEALKHNSSLTELVLGSNKINAEGAIALANALRHNSVLNALWLCGNEIEDDGAIALANMLGHNSSLTELGLLCCVITAKGAIAFAEAIKHNSSLTSLNLSENRIGSEGAIALANALEHNHSLTELCLWGNAIEVEVHSQIRSACQRNLGQIESFRLALLVSVLCFGTDAGTANTPDERAFNGGVPRDIILLLLRMAMPKPNPQYADKLLTWVCEHPPTLTKENRAALKALRANLDQLHNAILAISDNQERRIRFYLVKSQIGEMDWLQDLPEQWQQKFTGLDFSDYIDFYNELRQIEKLDLVSLPEIWTCALM